VNWDYRLEAGALKDLRDLGPSARGEIVAYLDRRLRGAVDPRRFGKPLRGDRKGTWRYRVRDYRVLCRLEDRVMIVTVIAAGHRSTVYDG